MTAAAIRDARPGDADAIARHSMALAAESEGRIPDVATVAGAVRAAIDDPRKARYFVAEDDGALVASCFVTFEWSDWTGGWYWWVQGLYVEPAARRGGVAAALLAHVRATAAAEGARSVRLYVAEGNTGARDFYAATGWRELPYRIFEAGGP